MTASKRWFSTISFLIARWALELLERTPFGTMDKQRPPILSIRTKSEINSNSVFVVLVVTNKSLEIDSLSKLHANGGLARIKEKLSRQALSSERESCHEIFGSSTP